MRRLAAFGLVLLLVGLSTAFAASFDVQSEDIATFTTDVSISVPTTTTTAPPTLHTLYLGGTDGNLPGTLDEQPESTTSKVHTKSIKPGTGSVASQVVTDRYHSWQSPPAPVGGYVITGIVTVWVTQVGGGGTVLAGLFDCPATAGATVVGCTQFAGDQASVMMPDNEVAVQFGTVAWTIPEGRALRLQIMNPTDRQWLLQWGYKTNRPSRLEITLAAP